MQGGQGMPSRIIREQICTSDTLAAVSPQAERLFWRLVVQADDFGLLDGRPRIVLGKCLTALIGTVTEDDVANWLSELDAAGLIQRYEVDGRPYLHLTTWEKHQRPPKSTSRPRHPMPPSSGPSREEPGTSGKIPETPAKGYRVKGKGYGGGGEADAPPSSQDEQDDNTPTFRGDIERDAATLVALYHEYSPVSGKDAVRMNVRRNREMTAALKAGCRPETLARVIQENAAAGMEPWNVRITACKLDGIGKVSTRNVEPRASPLRPDYETWKRLFLNAATGTYTEDELRRMYREEVVGVGAG